MKSKLPAFGPQCRLFWRVQLRATITWNRHFWIGSFYKKELSKYLNPRTVSDDFHEEIEDEELREEVDDEEALENGNKGDQEAIVVEILMCIYFTVWALRI